MNKGISTLCASLDSPIPSKDWLNTSEIERLSKIKEVITSITKYKEIDFTRAYNDGQVSLALNTYMEAKIRGPLLLDLEEYLKSIVEECITVWHDPIGDKNSLRKQIRGIEVYHE